MAKPDKEEQPEIEGEWTPATNPALDKDVAVLKWSVYKDGKHIAEKFDDNAKKLFLAAYVKYLTKTRAARAAGVTLVTVNVHMKKDKNFAAACEAARQMIADRVDETAHHVALEGVLEPIFSKDGVLLGHKRVFNGNILAMLMRRFQPEYRDKAELDVNHGGGVLLIPMGGPVPTTPEDNQRNGELLAIAHSKEPGT